MSIPFESVLSFCLSLSFLSPQSHLAWWDLDLRAPRQCSHCFTGRPLGLMWCNSRSVTGVLVYAMLEDDGSTHHCGCSRLLGDPLYRTSKPTFRHQSQAFRGARRIETEISRVQVEEWRFEERRGKEAGRLQGVV